MERELYLKEYLKSLDKSYSLTFVQKGDDDQKAIEAYQKSLSLFPNININLSMESEVQNISKADIKKGKHLFVFDKFDTKNSAQNYVKSGTILGLSLMDLTLDSDSDVAINESNSVFSTAFKGMAVCASNIHSAQKRELAELIEAMNGKFHSDLTEDTTHLITNTTQTIKYEAAVKQNIPIYHIDWVQKVFQETTTKPENSTLPADDEKFSIYILPPFFDLKITTTGVSLEEREKIKQEIEEHGGSFEEIFRKETIDILIVGDKIVNHDKLKIARSTKKIACLNVQWIYDSINAQHALPYDDYRNNQQGPKSGKENSKSSDAKITTPTVTVKSDAIVKKATPKKSQKTEVVEEKTPPTMMLKEIFSKVFTKEKVSKAGPIFDGIHFHIFDFNYDDTKKLKKILLTCGGFCTDYDEKVTHVICYDENSHDNLKDITNRTISNKWNPTIVKFQWIVDCIEKGELIPLQKDYIIKDFNNSENVGRTPNKIIKPPEKSKKNSARKRRLTQTNSTKSPGNSKRTKED